MSQFQPGADRHQRGSNASGSTSVALRTQLLGGADVTASLTIPAAP